MYFLILPTNKQLVALGRIIGYKRIGNESIYGFSRNVRDIIDPVKQAKKTEVQIILIEMNFQSIFEKLIV